MHSKKGVCAATSEAPGGAEGMRAFMQLFGICDKMGDGPSRNQANQIQETEMKRSLSPRVKLGRVLSSPIGQRIAIPQAIVILGSAAVGAFVGAQLGGPQGAVVGTLVAAFVGALAAGAIRDVEIGVGRFGAVTLSYHMVGAEPEPSF